MRLAIFWSEILHYHAARIKALCSLAEAEGFSVFPFALRPSAPDLPIAGYHDLLQGRIEVLSQEPEEAGLYAKVSQLQTIRFLDLHRPEAVGIPGYDSPVALSALQWCRRYGRGAVLMSDSKEEDYRRYGAKEYLKGRLVRLFDSAFVAGKPQAAYIRKLGMESSRIFFGVDAVDNDFWADWSHKVSQNHISWQAKLGLAPSFFLTVCRLVPKKNVAGLLSAYARYVQRTKAAWPLVIVGDGPLREETRQQANRLGIEKDVKFVGYLNADELAPYYSLASVFILASDRSEQWGLVVNEAMAAGLPVLVSKACGCVSDLVMDGLTGFSFDPKKEQELADLLTACSRNEYDLRKMGACAQDQVAKFHTAVFARNFADAAGLAIEYAGGRRFGDLTRLYLDAFRRTLRPPSRRFE